jgi:hypothetical protein
MFEAKKWKKEVIWFLMKVLKLMVRKIQKCRRYNDATPLNSFFLIEHPSTPYAATTTSEVDTRRANIVSWLSIAHDKHASSS